jgi:hypothetical protein
MFTIRDKDNDWFGSIVVAFLLVAWFGGMVGGGSRWGDRLFWVGLLGVVGLAGYGAWTLIAHLVGG